MYRGRAVIILSLVLFVFLLVPVAFLFIGTSFFPTIGGSSFSFYQFITSPDTAILLFNTIIFSVGHAIFAVALATVYAWIVVRTDIPGKRVFQLLPILGLTMPVVVKAFAWTFIFSPRVGAANQFLTYLFGPGAPGFDIYSMGGLIFAGSVGAIPLAYLIMTPPLKSLDSSLEEASKVAGKGLFRTLRKVTLPLVLPAALSAFVLVTLGGLNNFEYPYIIGGPANIHVLSTEVYYWSEIRSPPAYGSSGIVSILYVLVAFVGLSIYILLTRRSYRYVVVTGKPTQKTPQRLGRWKYVAVAICSSILLVEFILPFGALVFLSMSSAFIPGLPASFRFDFPNAYTAAMNLPLFFNSLETTIFMALGAALSATLIGAVLSYAALRRRATGARLIEYVTSIPLAFPGVVYGLAVFWTFLLLPGINLIYGTIWPLVISLTFIRLPYSTRIISGNLVQISDDLEEASQVGGASFLRTFWRVLAPLMKPGLANSFAYIFVDSMRELGGVIILVTPGTLVYTTLLLDFYESHALVTSVLSAGSVILTAIIVAALIAMHFFQRYWGGGESR